MMNLAKTKKGAAGFLAAGMLFAQAIPAFASSYCVRFNGSFQGGQLDCPGQLPPNTGDENTEGYGQGRISSGVKQTRVNLFHLAYDYDYTAAYTYGAASDGSLVTSCHAIRYSPGLSAWDNCPSTTATFNLYIYAG